MNHASICTGLGAFELAASWLGMNNIFASETDHFCRTIIKYHFPQTKLYGDIKKEDFRKYRGCVDMLTAGFPCQPFSIAGDRTGENHDSYLWPDTLRVINEVRPTWFIGENVAGLASMVFAGDDIKVESKTDLFGEDHAIYEKRERYILEKICIDLESIGYSVQPVIIPACAVGAPHRRDRIWIIAHSDSDDAGRCGYGEIGKTERACETEAKERKWVRCDVERDGNEKSVTNSNEFNGNLSRFCTSKISQPKETGVFINKNVSDSKSKRLPIWNAEQAQFEPYTAIKRYDSIPQWEDFPTQSPVCRRDDGLSERLDGITFSKWRSESIKSFGNAIVPQEAYLLLKAIKETETYEKIE